MADKIEPVAWRFEDHRPWMANRWLGHLTSPPDPAMHLKVEPLYSQQQLDALVAEMDSWKEMYAGAITRAERAEAEAADLRLTAEAVMAVPELHDMACIGSHSPAEHALGLLRYFTTPRGQEG